MKEIFLAISVIISLISPVVAIVSIFRGEYKPQRTTRFLYVLIVGLFVGTLFASGEKAGLPLAITQFIYCCVIFVLSLKYGMGGKGSLDFFVVLLAFLAILVWYTTNNPVLGLYFSILTDFIATSPTLIKSFKKPFTESPIFYLCDVFAGIFTILGIEAYSAKSLAFPGYIFLVNLLLVCVNMFSRRFNPQLKS